MLNGGTLSYDNALDHALGTLHAAATAMERNSKPTLADVEEARDRAKAAHKVLEASFNLMALGLFTVAEDPNTAKEATKGTPMFAPDLAPTPEAEAGAATPAPEPVPAGTLGYTDHDAVDVEIVSHPLDGLEPEAARALYADKVQELHTRLLHCGTDESLADEIRADWLKAELDDPVAPLRYHFDILTWALEQEGPYSDSAVVAEAYEAAHHQAEPDADSNAELAEPNDRIYSAVKARARETGSTSTKTIRAEFTVSLSLAKAIMERLFQEGIIDEAGKAVA